MSNFVAEVKSMSLRILRAIYKKDGIEKEIALSEITDEMYKSTYKGYLFCPTPDCEAKIEFASGPKLTYFRTWKTKVVDGEILNEHLKDCTHYVERDAEEKARRRSDPDLYYKLSAEHIRAVLKRAYDREFNPDKYRKKDPIDSEGIKKRPSSRSRTDYGLEPKGKAGLVVDGAIAPVEKEPSVYRISIDDISDDNYNSVQCIYGYAVDMVISGDSYPYMVLTTNNNRNGRILFSESFAVNNQIQFDNIEVYKNYINAIIKTGRRPYVCCVGKITQDEYGNSVVVEDYQALRIDDKGYYQIISEINKIG